MRLFGLSLYNDDVKLYEAVADPTRRRLLEVLALRECSAGELSALVAGEFGLSQPATSRHLRVLREADLVQVRVDGTRRIYALQPSGLREIDDWLSQFRQLWSTALTALEVEVARGRDAAHPTEDGDTA